MTKYKDIIGTDIQVVTTDPTEVTGQVWYNSDEGELKTRNQFVGNAWASGGNLPVSVQDSGAFGTQTAAINAGGYDPSAGEFAEFALYNGTSWTDTGDINKARYSLRGAGTTTAGLIFGGISDPDSPTHMALTESWNGSAWTEVADLNSARGSLGGCGGSSGQTASLATGGVTPPGSTRTAVNESWNGSAWTEVGDLNTARRQLSSAGTTTSALAFAGETPGSDVLANTEAWNGSAWYEVNDLNTASKSVASAGTQEAALAAGGSIPAVSSKTELWNGAVWSETNDMNVSKSARAGAGSQTAALAIGGAPNSSNLVEEWNADIAIGAWATGNDLNTARNNLNGQNVGTQTAALVGGGQAPPRTTNTELYNGNSWFEVNNMNVARYGGAVVGTQTSCLFAGGNSGNPSPENPGFKREALNELWNGSVWTESSDLNSGRSDVSGAGASNTAAIVNGGKAPLVNPPGGLIDRTESWNGSSWTEVADLNTAREQIATVGTQTAALGSGGQASPGPVGLVESWNGSAWTETTDLNLARTQSGSCGIYTSSLIFGGTPPNTASVEEWNGTNWSNVDNLNTAAAGIGGAGTTTAGLAYGGFSTTTLASTEEWFGEGIVTEKISSS